MCLCLVSWVASLFLLDVVYCPRLSCGSAVIKEMSSKAAVCSVCVFAFCVSCRKTYHGTDNCQGKKDIRNQTENNTQQQGSVDVPQSQGTQACMCVKELFRKNTGLINVLLYSCFNLSAFFVGMKLLFHSLQEELKCQLNWLVDQQNNCFDHCWSHSSSKNAQYSPVPAFSCEDLVLFFVSCDHKCNTLWVLGCWRCHIWNYNWMHWRCNGID